MEVRVQVSRQTLFGEILKGEIAHQHARCHPAPSRIAMAGIFTPLNQFFLTIV